MGSFSEELHRQAVLPVLQQNRPQVGQNGWIARAGWQTREQLIGAHQLVRIGLLRCPFEVGQTEVALRNGRIRLAPGPQPNFRNGWQGNLGRWRPDDAVIGDGRVRHISWPQMWHVASHAFIGGCVFRAAKERLMAR